MSSSEISEVELKEQDMLQISLVQWDILTHTDYNRHYKYLLTLFVTINTKNLFHFKPTYSQVILQNVSWYSDPGKDTFKIKLLCNKVFIT